MKELNGSIVKKGLLYKWVIFLLLAVVASCQQEIMMTELDMIQMEYKQSVVGSHHEKDIYLQVDWTSAQIEGGIAQRTFTFPMLPESNLGDSARLVIVSDNGKIVSKKILVPASLLEKPYASLYKLQSGLKARAGAVMRPGYKGFCANCHTNGVPIDPIIIFPPGGGPPILVPVPEDPWPPWPGGGGGGLVPPPPPRQPSEQEIKDQIKDKPFALFGDLDCNIVKKWLATAKHQVQQAQIDKLNSIRFPNMTHDIVARVQDIDNAYSTVVNMDYFPVTVNQLPVVNGNRLTPSQFIEYIRKNINSFVNTDKSEFTPYNYLGINDYNLWQSGNPLNAVVGIDIPGDDGAVIVSKHSNTGWTFTTIFDPIYGNHPVSGNRDFGYVQNANGSYTFYTRGVDRLTYAFGAKLEEYTRDANGNGLPFRQADELWTSFQEKIKSFVVSNQGQAAVATKEIQRPDWQRIKDVLDGIKPLSSLSTDCKD